MKLEEAVYQLDQLEDDLIICAEQDPHWTSSSMVEMCTDEIMNEKKNKYPYFLEVFLAKDVLQAWSFIRDGREPNLGQKCEALIFYAENHAYIQPEHEKSV